MKQLSFAKFDPGGNPTILIDNRRMSVASEDYPHIATVLMREPFLGSEQVGFLEPPLRCDTDGRLVMMGGELCINALRCIGAFLWLEGRTRPLSVEASGTNELVQLTVEADNDVMESSVMVPFDLECNHLSSSLTMVSMPGMVHFVEEVEEHPGEREMSRRLARAMAGSMLSSAPTPDAVGYITVTAAKDDRLAIQPLVHVTKTGTTVMETSCGSGSLAAFAAFRSEVKRRVSVLQPSGSLLSVRPGTNGKLCITGEVRLSVSGTVHGVNRMPSVERLAPAQAKSAVMH